MLSRLVWIIVLCLVSVAYVGLLTAVLDLIGVEGPGRIPYAVVARVWPALGAGLGAASLLFAYVWWGFSRRIGSRSLVCAIKSAALLAMIAGFISAGLELKGSRVAVASAEVMSHWTYGVRADPAHGRLIIKGPIGPRFAAAVAQGLTRLPDPVTVEIESPGGLVDEALKAARVIDARPGATVVAHRWCASACMIVLMSGERRLADGKARFGFHAAAPLVRASDPLFALSFDWQRQAAEAYLIRRGAPADLIAQADRVGPRRVVTLTAAQALDRGVLTGITPSPRRSHTRSRPLALTL